MVDFKLGKACGMVCEPILKEPKISQRECQMKNFSP